MTETLSILTEAALRPAALGLGAGALLWVWRRRSASIAHGVWVAVVLGMLALPLLTLAPRLPFAVPSMAESVPAVSLPGGTHASTVLSGEGVIPLPAARQALRDPVGKQRQPLPTERLGSWPWARILTGLYLGVSVLMLLSLLRGWTALRVLGRTAREIDDPRLDALVGELRSGRSIRISTSPAVRVPITFGFVRPRVFLPESWRSWSDDKLRAVLAHELSHVRRGDFLWIVLAELNKCLYWFHPLAWIARRRLATVAEEASDADAAGQVGSRTVYARALVEIAALVKGEHGRVTRTLVAVPMASSNELTQRVESVLRSSGPRAVPRRGRIAASVAFGVLTLLSGTIELVAQSQAVGPEFDRWVQDLSHADPERRARAALELSLDEERWDDAIVHLVALLGDDAEIAKNPWKNRVFPSGNRWQPARSSWLRPSPGETATIALASMSSRAAEPLVEALGHGDPVVRRNAAWGLGELRHPRGIPRDGVDALVATFDDPDASVRAAVAWSLGDIRVRPATSQLIEALRHDRNARVRAMAANALGEIRAADAEDALDEAARNDPSSRVRRAARYGLKEVLEHGY